MKPWMILLIGLALALAACSGAATPEIVFPTATVVTRAPAPTPTAFPTPTRSVGATGAAPASSPTPASPTTSASSATAVRPTGTVTATAVTTATVALPTAATGPAAAPRVVAQTLDNSIVMIDLDGKSSLVAMLNIQLEQGTANPGTNAISSTVFAALPGAGVVAVDALSMRPVSSVRPPLNGFAVGGPLGSARLAWATINTVNNKLASELFSSEPDGSDARSLFQESASGEPRGLHPFLWSADGKRLFYSREPVGLGGYILFGGITNLSQYTPADGKSKEILKDKQFGNIICIDDLSANERYVAYHCGDKTIGVFDLTTLKATTIQPPAQPQFAVLGSVRFSPDSARVAFAAARRNPDDEQGWVMVSDSLTGAARLVATSPAKDYFQVVLWLNANTLLLQSHGSAPAIWTVRTDGTNLRRLGDGTYLGVIGLK